jgi:hypothetical protein
MKGAKFFTIVLVVLMMIAWSNGLAEDKDNMKWKLAWTTPATGPIANVAITGEVPVPYRFYNSEAWFDFDGDGNKEFYAEDQDPFRGYVYEADGNDSYVYRWHIDYFDTTGNLLNNERSSHGTDCDGDGADELIHQHTVPILSSPRHIPPIRVFKHTAGSAQFLPDPWHWTVAWDAVPTGQGDGSFRPEYYTDAGDFDNDGYGEFAINYKRDPLYHFAIVQVTPPLTPEGVQFNVELMVNKEEYMKPGKDFGNGYNSCRIDAEDLDNDGRAEFFLFNRESPAVLPQADYYVDCTGPNTYDVHGFFKNDPIVMPVPYIRIGENYDFIDLDHDGIKELVCYGKGLTDDVGKFMELWVGKLNPSDPAHVVSADHWYLIKTIDQMLGVAPGKYTKQGGGWLEVGDADKDGYSDIYFGAGSDGLVMDVEFTGTDISNPDHYKYYPILTLQKALNDTINSYHAARSAIGDGDSDGQTDIVLWSKSEWDKTKLVPRPGIYVIEFGPGNTATGIEQQPIQQVSKPESFILSQNYPNPFNPTTTLSYSLEQSADVNLSIYNINGRLIQTLVDAKQARGGHSIVWDGTDSHFVPVASGVYFYVLSVNSIKSVKKMTLMK